MGFRLQVYDYDSLPGSDCVGSEVFNLALTGNGTSTAPECFDIPASGCSGACKAVTKVRVCVY